MSDLVRLIIDCPRLIIQQGTSIDKQQYDLLIYNIVDLSIRVESKEKGVFTPNFTNLTKDFLSRYASQEIVVTDYA